jgi:tetratricopeptide (TPR) repeat protein
MHRAFHRLAVAAALATGLAAFAASSAAVAQGNSPGANPPGVIDPPGSGPRAPNPHENNPQLNPHGNANPHWVEPPPEARGRRGGPTRSLDFLFGALKVAPDDDSAKTIENRIWAAWLASGSDTVNLLMNRAKSAVESNDLDLAIRLLDSVIELKPKYIEAWNRRATVFFLKKDYGNSLRDLRKVLAMEPRHFGALTGLGMILQDIGDEKHALDAYRKAVEVYPRLKGMDDKIKTLKEKVEGRDT